MIHLIYWAMLGQPNPHMILKIVCQIYHHHKICTIKF
jgi:hypothetical protein